MGSNIQQSGASAHVRDLIWTLIRTDFKVRYHGTFGGYLWALAKPLSMFVVLLGVFSLIFSMDPNYPLNLIIGLYLWDFFAEATRAGLAALHSKGYLLTRAKFPSWIVIVASCSNALITVTIFSAVVITYVAVFKHPLSLLHVVLLCSYVLCFTLIIVGFALAASTLFLRFRDLNQVWDLVLQAGFFIAPVIYPLNIIPEQHHIYLYLWLPTPVMQFTRSILVDGQIPSLRAHILLVAAAIVSMGIGAVVYRLGVQRSIEEV
jgi:ABC-type polysaccharide/polyol phosphate export permease